MRRSLFILIAFAFILTSCSKEDEKYDIKNTAWVSTSTRNFSWELFFGESECEFVIGNKDKVRALYSFEWNKNKILLKPIDGQSGLLKECSINEDDNTMVMVNFGEDHIIATFKKKQ